jgi:hypothetical protein
MIFKNIKHYVTTSNQNLTLSKMNQKRWKINIRRGTKLEGAHKRRKAGGDKHTQSTKKDVSHIVELGPENTLADPPNDSLINRQIWGGSLRISLMCGSDTTRCSSP